MEDAMQFGKYKSAQQMDADLSQRARKVSLWRLYVQKDYNNLDRYQAIFYIADTADGVHSRYSSFGAYALSRQQHGQSMIQRQYISATAQLTW